MAQPPASICRVALVDDHALVRVGFERLVNEMPGYHTVLHARHGEEFIVKLRTQEVDIAIMDLSMPLMDGFETIRWIEKHKPAMRTLVLTFDASEEALARAIRLGARGYLLKDIEPEELARALNAIRDTGYYHNDLFDQHQRNNPDGFSAHERARNAVLEKIGPRQMEYIRLVADPREYTREGIAEIMNVHPSSVDHYFQGLRHDFGVRSKTGVLIFAIKWGLITLEEIQRPPRS